MLDKRVNNETGVVGGGDVGMRAATAKRSAISHSEVTTAQDKYNAFNAVLDCSNLQNHILSWGLSDQSQLNSHISTEIPAKS
eukprot:5853361-Amphidinium_carterae.1